MNKKILINIFGIILFIILIPLAILSIFSSDGSDASELFTSSDGISLDCDTSENINSSTTTVETDSSLQIDNDFFKDATKDVVTSAFNNKNPNENTENVES